MIILKLSTLNQLDMPMKLIQGMIIINNKDLGQDMRILIIIVNQCNPLNRYWSNETANSTVLNDHKTTRTLKVFPKVIIQSKMSVYCTLKCSQETHTINTMLEHHQMLANIMYHKPLWPQNRQWLIIGNTYKEDTKLPTQQGQLWKIFLNTRQR